MKRDDGDGVERCRRLPTPPMAKRGLASPANTVFTLGLFEA